MLADLCADPGIFARVVQARLPENSSDNVFCLFFSKKTIILQGLGGGGGVQPIPGGRVRGLGVQMLILETHRTFDFPGRGADPISPSGSAHLTI